MNDADFRRIVAELLREQRRLRDRIDHRQQPSKDIWDKFAAISTFLSGVLIAAAGLLVSAEFNDRQAKRDEAFKTEQNHIQKTEVAYKFLPLLEDDKTRKVGVLMISELSGDCVFATKLAAGYLKEGSVPAVSQLLQTCPKAKDALGAKDVLAQIATANLGEDSRLAKIALNPQDKEDFVVEADKNVQVTARSLKGERIQFVAASLDGKPLTLDSAGSSFSFYSGAGGRTRFLSFVLTGETAGLPFGIDINGNEVDRMHYDPYDPVSGLVFAVK